MGRPFYTHTTISDDSALGGTTIQKSLRFNRTDTPYLQATLGNSNVDKWTWSGWVKKTVNGQHQNIFSSGSDNVVTMINFDNNDKIKFQNWHSAQKGTKITTRVFRDNSAWMHIVAIWDSGNSTADDRIRIYVNGTRETSFSSSSNPDQNQDSVINGNTLGGSTYGEGKHFIGKFADTSDHSGSYKAEINFVDGYAYDPSYFGYTDFQTKLWRPKRYTGSYGTNGFHLNFLNNDTFTDFTDTSSSARTITRNGNVIHKSDQTKNGATSIYFDGSGDSLTVPDSSDFHVAGNDFTIEAYIRRTSQGNDEWFFVQSEGTTSNTSIGLHIGSSSSGYANKPSLRYTVGGSGNELTGTTALAANTWYHIAGVRNGNTLRIYVNGTQEASTSFSGTITDASTRVIIGAVNSAGAAGLTGHMDQVRWSNSCRYPDGTSFTAPTAQFTADSNTKLLVQSNVTKTLGSDSSGNGNDFTSNNFSVSAGVGNDSVEDAPTNNFPTLNPLFLNATEAAGTFSEGNLKVVTTGSEYGTALSTFSIRYGKYYWEVKQLGGSYATHGIVRGSTPNADCFVGYDPNGKLFGFGYNQGGNIKGASGTGTTSNANLATSLATFTTNDIIGFASDISKGTLAIYKNNTLIYTITGINDDDWIPAISGYTSNGSYSINFGQQPFNYTPPTGYNKLNSNNLLPTVPSIENAQKHFDNILYTGNGGTKSVTGLGFKPDFVWVKSRNAGYNNYLFDILRGSTNALRSNTTAAESQVGNSTLTLTSNGFKLTSDGLGLNSAHNMVAWCWKAGGVGVTNNDGTKSVTLSANPEAGFSIIEWAGNDANATCGHGLGKKPKFFIVKSRTHSQNWFVYHVGTGATKDPRLNDTAAPYTTSNIWNNTEPTDTVINIGSSSGVNGNGNSYICYCWSEIPGYSKMGTYVGNGNANGAFVHTGFRPSFIMIRNTVNGHNWQIYDVARSTINPALVTLYANRDLDEEDNASVTPFDILSNGFKIRSTWNDTNQSGSTILYMAWAEQSGSTAYSTEANAR